MEQVKREKDEEAEGHICFGQPRLEEILIAGEENSSRNEPRLNRSIDPFSPKKKNDNPDPSRNRRRQSGNQRGHCAIKRSRKCNEPEEKGWFIHIDFSIQVRDPPFSGSNHLPGDFCITNITMILKAPGPEIKKEDETTGEDETPQDPSLSSLPTFHIVFLFNVSRKWIS
jgi:hypothetical protein